MYMGYVAYTILGSVGGISSTLAVGLAGVVVVVTVVLVFIMLLRSNGAGKRTASGLGYDADGRPFGPPPGDPNAAWPGPRGANAPQGWPQTDHYDYPSAGQNPAAPGAGWDQGFGGQMGSAAPASQGGWAGAPAQGAAAWTGAPVGQNAGPGMASAWGNEAGAPAWSGQNDQWGQNNQNAWEAQPTPSGRLASNAGAGAGWDSSHGARGAASAGPAGGQWGDQASGVNAQWGAQAPLPAQRDWAANAAPQPGAGWGGQMPGGPMPGGFDANFGEGDKTRVVRPGNGQQRIGMIVIRQGKEPGRVFELRKDRLTIGRSRESDIFLEDLAVSRLHTTVNSDGIGHYIIRDEGSANGTYVNQQRVTEQALEEGDEIQVGQTVLAFVRR
jgi:Inner membrane component of T3SS, cytoplasmic domain